MAIIRTLKEAKKYRYDVSGMTSLGNQYEGGRCAEEICDFKRRRFPQCSRKNGHGPGKLYCKQHAKRIEGMQ
jgi:hypothetical protein